MARLTPRFSANRAVREYTEQYYIPAATAYRQRAADKGAMGVRIVEWQRALRHHWYSLRFGELKVVSDERKHLFEVQVYLGDLDSDNVQVELYADGVDGGEPICREMTRDENLTDGRFHIYRAQVASARSASDYTARVVPRHNRALIPLEASQILWQR
jgi:glycogen phosphorylase